jgi:hypothetical protein
MHDDRNLSLFAIPVLTEIPRACRVDPATGCRAGMSWYDCRFDR